MNRRLRITSLVIAATVVAAACGPRLARAVVTPSGLTYTIVEKGKGPSAKPGNYVTIEETTALADGRVHFTTDGRKPIRFLLGGKQVIDGLDEGVTCMKVGERRKLIVPPSLSKRSGYPAGLSSDDVLFYDVKVVGIESARR